MWTLWWERSASWRTNCLPHSSHLNRGLWCWCMCSLSLARDANFLWQISQVWSYLPLKQTDALFITIIQHQKHSFLIALLLTYGRGLQPFHVSGILCYYGFGLLNLFTFPSSSNMNRLQYFASWICFHPQEHPVSKTCCNHNITRKRGTKPRNSVILNVKCLHQNPLK